MFELTNEQVKAMKAFKRAIKKCASAQLTIRVMEGYDFQFYPTDLLNELIKKIESGELNYHVSTDSAHSAQKYIQDNMINNLNISGDSVNLDSGCY